MPIQGTLEYDHSIHQKANAGDDNLLVKFYIGPVQDQAASKKEGRPIYKDVEWIDIRIPGSKDNIVIRPVRETDKQRFYRHYEAFQRRTESQVHTPVGTPLSVWPRVTPAQAKELEFFNIMTVENLAGAPDGAVGGIIGINKLKQDAQRFLEVTAKQAPLVELNDKMDAMQASLDVLQATNKKLRRRIRMLKKAKAE
jgi:hypothetical protein